MRATVRACLIAVAAVVLPAFAQTRPDYSGEWVLRADRSGLDQRVWAGLEKFTVRIAHREPRFEFRHTSVTNGKTDVFGWTLTTDGREQVITEGTVERHSRLAWSEGILVLSQRVVAPMGEATNTVEYRLLEGGRVLEAHERFKGPRLQYENRYVFEKQ